MTDDVLLELRKWLQSLGDADLKTLLAICAPLRRAASMPVHGRLSRSPAKRHLLTMKVWLTKAYPAGLAELTDEVLSIAARVLTEHLRFETAVVEAPNHEQLSEMLKALGQPFGRLVLFVLLVKKVQAHPLAVRHRVDLEKVLRSAPASPVEACMEVAEKLLLHRPGEAVEDDVPDRADGESEATVSSRMTLADAETLTERLAELRGRAAETAERLRLAADEIRCGVGSAVGVDEPLSEYRKQYAEYHDSLGQFISCPADADFDQLDSLVADVRADLIACQQAEQEEVRRQQAELEKEGQIEELREQLANLDRMIANSPETVREPLRSAAAATRIELDQLLGDSAVEVGPDLVTSGKIASPAVEQTETGLEARPSESEVEPSQSAQLVELMGEERPGTNPTSPPLTDELTLGFPWEEGNPPLAIELARRGRLAEAYWVTAVSGEPSRRADVLRFAAAAYAVTNNTDATTLLTGLDLDVQGLIGDMEAVTLATTAALRAGLVAGWGPSILAQLVPTLVLPGAWAKLVHSAVDAVRRGVHVEDGLDGLLVENDAHEARADLGRRARNLAEELPLRKNPYQRATRVLQRLLLSGQPLATALDSVILWSEGSGTAERVAEEYVKLNAPGAVDEMIEAADAAMRTPKQAKEPIVASALRTLVRAIDEVCAIVRAADAVGRRLTVIESGDQDPTMRLSQALVGADAEEPPNGMTGVALSLFRRWLHDPDGMAGVCAAGAGFLEPLSAGSEPSVDVLLVLPDLPRMPDGRPDPDDVNTLVMMAGLTRSPNVGEVVSTYCDRGDLRSARRVVDLVGEGFWGEENEGVAVKDVVDRAVRTWSRKHEVSLREARDLFDRIRTQNLLDPVDETTVAGRLEALTNVADGAFERAAASLAELSRELADKHRVRVEELGAEVGKLPATPADRARIVALLDDGDTVTAAEFIAFVRAGKGLPEFVEESAEDVDHFTEVLRRGTSEESGGPGRSASAWSEAAVNGVVLTHVASSGVQSWDSLSSQNGLSGDRFVNAVRDILLVLGLRPSSRPQELQRRARSGFRKCRVQGSPTDGSYVSTLGSGASSYTVTVIFEEHRGRRSVFDVLGPEDNGRANVLVYLHTLDFNARRALAAEASRSTAQALVIDPAVMGWVAAKAPGSWRATQRVTLPWTALNPYTPFVAGLVPPEMFVGRVREMAEVVDPHGGLFLYGGRQLGKSALLRRVEATFNDREYRYAVYLDLKGRGIGEAEPASRIWRELVLELKKRDLLSDRVSQDAPADVVVQRIRGWLEDNPSRRLLVLLDEADAFLTADSRGVPSPGGVAHFLNVLRLKELMESTERRFKVVFAGLHQVQRFGHLSNVPLVHGGPDILVGPLDQADARRLVTAPLAALGYRFERPELVWRLLSATNYQASLIQIFCEELVRTLQERVSQSAVLPVPIREADVEAVAASDRVRARIAERLRITINLEDRYRVLTLVIAVMSLTDMFGAHYAPDELLEEARNQWPVGFEDLTASQLRIYLDEMVGLGLLIRLSGQDRYAVRSPNVVNMLGTKASLKLELADTDFDLPYQYNPRDARRLLLSAQGVERRSPLTDGQLLELTKAGAVSFVAGTKALATDRVPAALKDYAEMRGSKVEVHSSVADITRAMTNVMRRKKPTVLVADVHGWATSDILRIRDRLVRDSITAVLLAAPGAFEQVGAVESGQVMRPARWTTGSLRSWPECPFDVLHARARLIEVTGGWPELVEDVIAMVATRGATQAQALDRAERLSANVDWSRGFLDQAGLSASMLEQIGLWVDYVDPGEIVSPADVASVLDRSLTSTTGLLDDLTHLGVLDESADGLALDRVVHRCMTTMRAQS
ncbi:hypothetical protein [Amycolatopsis magusensis]|uniref:hypothetical protein n=1 Tax=Amycolatopsis magusensis TaxID=882444 RepID=UPI0024A82270|nr:hypothetical protein [Amycolatopsis magusensis]MDI5975271.1 hypothetical protein [Amycolatopsis magusensis]